MREIKFRAWSKTGKRMIGWEEMTANHAKVYTYFLWTDMYKLMQYTGLKDKNGAEIYERDVLRWAGVNCLISWNKHGHFDCGLDSLNMAIAYHSEIIGNVHEHPELLVVE